MTDMDYMSQALELAQKGMGFVNPNPMVGAIIVKDNHIIGKGYHQKYGKLHAERNAFANCTEDTTGATMYVTLEPCCHYGKTPPCTETIIQHKIKRVVIGSSDPNPLVAGKGIKILQDNGIEVTQDVMKKECDELNEIFMHYITTGLPFVTMKYAMTLDGKIAAYTGDSKWITNEKTRNFSHRERLKHSAIMVGIGTVLADNPMLTCRMENGRNPIRIICDTNLRIPLNTNIVTTAKEIPTIIATSSEDSQRISQLKDLGCTVLTIPKFKDHVDLTKLMKVLGDMKIDSILLEGGAELNWSALNSGIVSKVHTYIAPKIFGGTLAKSPIGGLGVDTPNHAFEVKEQRLIHIDNDILIESRIAHVHGNY